MDFDNNIIRNEDYNRQPRFGDERYTEADQDIFNTATADKVYGDYNGRCSKPLPHCTLPERTLPDRYNREVPDTLHRELPDRFSSMEQDRAQDSLNNRQDLSRKGRQRGEKISKNFSADRGSRYLLGTSGLESSPMLVI